MNRGRNESSYSRRRRLSIFVLAPSAALLLVPILTSSAFIFSTKKIINSNFKERSADREIINKSTDINAEVLLKLNVDTKGENLIKNDATQEDDELLSKINVTDSIHKRYNFYKWDDPEGININSVISYLKWFAIHGLQSKKNFNIDHFPLIPMMLKHNPQNNLIEVRYSLAAMKKHSVWNHFYNDRVHPMLKFIRTSLENRLNLDIQKVSTGGFDDHIRLYQVFRKGTEIPVLFEVSDWNWCSTDYNPIFNPAYNHTFTKVGIIPIFSLAMKVNCNFTFSVPNYLAIRQAKQNSSEWDEYFDRSANEYPWESKASAAVWRGTHNPPRKFNRRWLVQYAKNTTVTTRRTADGKTVQSFLIDAEISNAKTKEFHMPFEDFQKYKAIIDIDGNGWSGRFQRLLCMNSVVVKFQPSALEYNSAETLTPWIHYIPADSDTLEKHVKFAVDEKNKDTVKQIISNAHEWCGNHFTLERMADDLLDIMSSYVEELDRADSNWEQIWKESSIDSTDKNRSSRNPATRVSGGEDDESDESRDDVHDLSSQVTPATSTGATSAARRSRASSGGSIRSRMSSVRGSLSPLYETKEEDGSEESSGRSSKRSRFDESLASPTSKRSCNDESLVSGRSGEDDESMVSDGSHSPSTMRSQSLVWHLQLHTQEAKVLLQSSTRKKKVVLSHQARMKRASNLHTSK